MPSTHGKYDPPAPISETPLTIAKVGGDLLFAGSLAAGIWIGDAPGLVVATISAAGVGYGSALMDLAANRRAARWARTIGDWRHWRTVRAAAQAKQKAGGRREADDLDDWTGRPDVWPTGAARNGGRS